MASDEAMNGVERDEPVGGQTLAARYAADHASIQAEVLRIWARVLQLKRVEPTDDFFMLGGDSLKAVELMIEVETRFGISVDPIEILERSTAETFAQGISEALRV